ncbi:beta-galactosidase [Candidatus Uhrbacteria bacterium]|nr:beta-galactosidase [Candidatus Uhrbacteria bacterium]
MRGAIQKIRGWFRQGRRTAVWTAFFLSLALGLLLVRAIALNLGLEERPVTFGATFSKPYAEQLGLDWKTALTDSMDELGIIHWRIPAYWDELEPEPWSYDFSVLDWQLEEISKRQGTVILAIGRKLPRWPECHVPEWAKYLPEEVIRQRLLKAMEATVIRYRDNPTVTVWQVENEPFFPFGECPKPDADFLKQEISLVKSLDARPVMVTESGELSTWVRAAGLADILGISTYRVVWSRYFGNLYWPVTPNSYRHRAEAIGPLVRKTIISELQAEPWTDGPIENIPLDRQTDIMDPKRLMSNVSFARRMGMDEAYLWGVEWWYWLRQHDRPEMWETARELMRKDRAPHAQTPR